MNWIQHMEAAEAHFRKEAEEHTDPDLKRAAIRDADAISSLIEQIENGEHHSNSQNPVGPPKKNTLAQAIQEFTTEFEANYGTGWDYKVIKSSRMALIEIRLQPDKNPISEIIIVKQNENWAVDKSHTWIDTIAKRVKMKHQSQG